jgi:hypothetical protein
MDAADFEIYLLGVTEIETLQILGAVFMPSIVGLLLAFFAVWLPDEDYVQQLDDRRRERRRSNDGERDDAASPYGERIRLALLGAKLEAVRGTLRKDAPPLAAPKESNGRDQQRRSLKNRPYVRLVSTRDRAA